MMTKYTAKVYATKQIEVKFYKISQSKNISSYKVCYKNIISNKNAVRKTKTTLQVIVKKNFLRV